jgi:hypothetical protein
MTPRKPQNANAAVTAAEFDFDAWLTEFQRPEFTRSLFKRADLAPRLSALEKQIDDLDTRIDKLERADETTERSLTDVNPLAELTSRREKFTTEYNELAEELNASAVAFTFRVPDRKTDHATIQGLMDDAGMVQPVKPENTDDEEQAKKQSTEFDTEFSVWWDALALRSMAVTCKSHTFTIPQWEALRDRVGEIAFNGLAAAWFEAVQAASPSTPFSLKPLHTPETGPSSPGSAPQSQ